MTLATTLIFFVSFVRIDHRINSPRLFFFYIFFPNTWYEWQAVWFFALDCALYEVEILLRATKYQIFLASHIKLRDTGFSERFLPSTLCFFSCQNSLNLVFIYSYCLKYLIIWSALCELCHFNVNAKLRFWTSKLLRNHTAC